jgi:hypothetical protein
MGAHDPGVRGLYEGEVMNGQEIFIFVFGLFVTLISIGPYLIIPFLEDEEDE